MRSLFQIVSQGTEVHAHGHDGRKLGTIGAVARLAGWKIYPTGLTFRGGKRFCSLAARWVIRTIALALAAQHQDQSAKCRDYQRNFNQHRFPTRAQLLSVADPSARMQGWQSVSRVLDHAFFRCGYVTNSADKAETSPARCWRRTGECAIFHEIAVCHDLRCVAELLGKAVGSMEDETELRAQLDKLRREHRDLDAEIDGLHADQRTDPLTLRRLKKRKLQLKDLIARIEDQLYPDIIA